MPSYFFFSCVQKGCGGKKLTCKNRAFSQVSICTSRTSFIHSDKRAKFSRPARKCEKKIFSPPRQVRQYSHAQEHAKKISHEKKIFSRPAGVVRQVHRSGAAGLHAHKKNFFFFTPYAGGAAGKKNPLLFPPLTRPTHTPHAYKPTGTHTLAHTPHRLPRVFFPSQSLR